MEDGVAGNSCEDALEVVLQETVHLWKVLPHKLILERAMDVQLETLLGSGGELLLLGACVVRELDRLVDGWEMNQRVEKTNPMEASFQHFFLIDVLCEIVPNDSELCGLDTLDGNGDVNNECDKAEAKGQEAASFASAHAAE